MKQKRRPTSRLHPRLYSLKVRRIFIGDLKPNAHRKSAVPKRQRRLARRWQGKESSEGAAS